MPARFYLFVLLFTSILICPNLRADDPDANLNADMQKIITAVKANDFTVAVDMMYGPVADAAGGRDKIKKQAADAQASLMSEGFKIISYDVVPPFTHISTSDRDYAIIPVHTVMEIQGHQVDSQTFQLAIRPHGTAKWEYFDGSSLTPDVETRYFPDLKDTTLPAVKRTMLK